MMTMMTKRQALSALLGSAAVMGLTTGAALAGATDPLFINLTSDDGHRVRMALQFGGVQLQRGHPLTIFLNDRAVVVASKKNSATYAEQQRTIADLIGKGAIILVCPMCMQHYGVQESDLLPGLLTGNPDRTGSALFRDNTKTMTW